MERTDTFNKNSSPGENAALIAFVASYWGCIPQQKLVGPMIPSTYAYGSIANAPTNPTAISQFIVFKDTTTVAEGTESSGVSTIPWHDIPYPGQATEVLIHAKYSIGRPFWKILLYPYENSSSEMIGNSPLITWSLPVQRASFISSSTSTAKIPTIPLDEELLPEEREARKKGLALVTHIEHLMQTDEGFRDWFQEGFDEIAAGHFVTFSEEGWKEE